MAATPKLAENYPGYTPAKQQPVKGLVILTHKIGASVYAKLVHEKSGLLLWSFTKAPLKGIRDFTAQVEQHLGGFDWTQSPAKLGKQEKAIRAATFSINPYKE